MDGLDICLAKKDDLNLMFRLKVTVSEGYNHGLNDSDCFLAADPEGFLVARLNGEPVSWISIVTYEPCFAFLGNYYTRPELRGRGIGYRLFQKALAACKASTIGLNSIPGQAKSFEKSGFVVARYNLQYCGIPSPTIREVNREEIVSIDETMHEAIATYDRLIFPTNRTSFLSVWLSSANHIGRAAVEDGRITGYGVIRSCYNGCKIGPLFADDVKTAERLFEALVEEARGGQVFIDIPESNLSAIDLCQRCGLQMYLKLVEMYRGPVPVVPLDRIFAHTTISIN